jgi:hypothetical protein
MSTPSRLFVFTKAASFCPTTSATIEVGDSSFTVPN